MTKAQILVVEEEQYRRFFEQSNDAVFIHTLDGDILDVNSQACKMLGYAREQLLSMPIPALHPEEALPGSRQAFQITREKGAARFESRFKKADGKIIDVEISSSVIDHEKGTAQGIIRDITERKQAEEALRESEQKFRQMAETINEIFWMSDPNSARMLYVSSAYEEIWGRTCQSVYEQPMSWVEAICPEDREDAIASFEKQARGEATYNEFRIVRAGGAIRWIANRAFPIKNEAGEVVRITGIAEDITERKKVEERSNFLARILRTSPMSVIATDRNGKIIYVNPAAEDLFGYEAEELLGQDPIILNAGPDADKLQREILKTIEQNRVWKGEILNRKKNGDLFYIYASVYQLLDEKGDFVASVGFQEDVTKRKRMEETLQNNIQELKTAYEQAKVFAQDLTRDITQRKRVEQALRESEERYRKLNEELEQRVANRTRDLSLLYEVTMIASESLDLETTLARSLNRVLAAIKRNAGIIHLLDDKEGRLRLAVKQGIPSQVAAEIESMPLSDELTGWMIEHGEPLLIPEVAADPRMPQAARTIEASYAYLGVPMRARGRVLGVLSVPSEKEQQFNAEEVALLASVADQVGVAVENARLRQQAERAAVIEERERLSRELHDSVSQSLYSLTLFAEAGENLIEAGDLEAAKHNLTRMGGTAQQALKEMRLLVYELRPLDLQREGLIGALHQRLSAVEGRVNIKARLVAEELVELPAPVEEELYRIAQEALNNALKHAAAASVTVYLRREGEQVVLEVVDDGTGFNPNAVSDSGGMGLVNMQERAEKLDGSLTILTTPGAGTRVKVSIQTGTSS
jgi:PAS domain S-box-containing protein